MESDIKKIIWPTDFSGNAENALSYVRSLTEKYQAEVHVLYVIEDIAHHEGWYGDFEGDHIAKLMDHANANAAERLEQVCAKYLEGCPTFFKHTAVGDPADEILKAIDEHNIDLVVMASKGDKGRFPFGSVTDKVVKNASVPVVTVPV
jgi:nucleotide-binding universal stress UspA family protein